MPAGRVERERGAHSSRTDLDPNDDVPKMSEWVEPAPSSPLIRRDKTSATVFFSTDAAGKQETRDTLAHRGG